MRTFNIHGTFPLNLSVSPAPLVTVAPSDKQTELLTVLQWANSKRFFAPLKGTSGRGRHL